MPHPGWRHRVPDGVVVLTDQAAALARVDELVDGELWRADRRAVALAVLRGLVYGMDWGSGLVAGVTRAHLAAAAGCSLRTVTRILAWAQDAELLVCVETGATAEFLGTTANRAPSYVLTRPVDTVVHPPACGDWGSSPRRDQGLEDSHDEAREASSWPVFDRAAIAVERTCAVHTLLERTGLAAQVVRWRAVAMLSPWFEAGWCVAGLLHALDHHPDRPGLSRGDAARAARDPLRVLGHRLAPWRGRLADLPVGLAAVDGHGRRQRTAATTDPGRAGPVASPATRAAARALFAQRGAKHLTPGQRTAARDRSTS